MDMLARKKPTTTPITIENNIIVKIISKINSSCENLTIILPIMKINAIVIKIPKATQNAAPLG